MSDPAFDNPRVFVPPPLIFASLLALGLWLDRSAHPALAMRLSGGALAFAGIALIVTALGLFRTSKTRPEPWQPSSALVVSGIYRFTRNPMYLGMALLCAGIALFFGSLGAILLTGVAALIVDRGVIVREEAYLERRFGEPYLAYRKSVRRWF